MEHLVLAGDRLVPGAGPAGQIVSPVLSGTILPLTAVFAGLA